MVTYMLNFYKSKLCFVLAVATTTIGCSRPPSLEATIKRFLLFPGTGIDGEMTQAICGWPVYLKMVATRLEIRRRAGATAAAGAADFTIDTTATAPNGITVVCAGVGSFTYQQRSGSASHGLRGRDQYQISDIRRTNPWPDSIARAANSPTTAFGALDTWSPITLQKNDVLPDMHPAVVIKFQIATPGRYKVRTRPAAGGRSTSSIRSAAYENERLLDEDASGKLGSWQLVTGAVSVIVDSTIPVQLEMRLSAE